MGGNKGGSSPPQVVLPGPTEEEIAIQKKQLELMQQQSDYMQQYFQNSQDDRLQMQEALTKLTTGRDLTDEETNLIGNLSDQYSSMLTKGITDGIVGEQLDRNRTESMADLVERGVLNSTTGQRVLGDIEKERSRLLADAADQAALQRLQLERDFRREATNSELARAQILSGVTGNLSQLANQAGQNASNIGSDVAGRLQQQRVNQFQVARDNAYSKYAYKQQRGKSNMGGAIGSLAGAGLGALLAIPTGGLSIAGGAALGGTLGGAAGTFF